MEWLHYAWSRCFFLFNAIHAKVCLFLATTLDALSFAMGLEMNVVPNRTEEEVQPLQYRYRSSHQSLMVDG